MKNLLWSLLCTVLLVQCVPMPTAPDNNVEDVIPGGLYVLCEGLWRQDNSTLAYVLPGLNIALRSVLAKTTPGVRLGDTGSDMIAMGDTLVIVMNASRSVELVQRSTGRWLGRIPMPLSKEPYRLCLSSDSTVYISNLNDDTVTELNVRTGAVRVEGLPTGPAPEGIDSDGEFVAVANSGLGDLRYTEPDAGTIYVYQRSDLQRIRVLRGVANVGSVKFDRPRRLLWASYRHRISEADSMGGVVVYDTRTWMAVRHWRVKSPGRLSVAPSGMAYCVTHSGVQRFDAVANVADTLVPWQGTANGVLYGLMVDEAGAKIYVCNAGQYVTDGHLDVYTMQGMLLGRYAVGLNPGVVVW